MVFYVVQYRLYSKVATQVTFNWFYIKKLLLKWNVYQKLFIKINVSAQMYELYKTFSMVVN